MASFLEREQLLPVAPSIAPADQILGAFNTKLSLYGQGAAQIKSAQNSYAQMQLTNPGNQVQLDGLMKTANQELKTASMSDLSVGDNQSKALNVFDPINKDADIMADSQLTQSWNNSRRKAESDKTSGGGKSYNQSAADAVNYQQALYAKADKSSWRSFYNTRETYSTYYNTQDEVLKLQKAFKTDVIDKEEQRGAYITTTKDSSWYKDKWQGFIEANASPQLKAQLATQARAEYYRDMLTMPREAIVQKYTDLRNGLVKKQMDVDAQNMMNIGASLAIKHDSKDHAALRASLIVQANSLNDSYTAKQHILTTALENADSIGTIEGMSVATKMAEQLGSYKYFDKIGSAFAHQDKKFAIKPDYAYLALTKIKEQSREFGIREAEIGRHNRADELHARNMEGIDMIKAQADMIRALKTGKGKGDGSSDEENNFSNSGDISGGLLPSSAIATGSDSPQTQAEGAKILDRLGQVQNKFNDNYDKISSAVFTENFMGSLKEALKDPNRQNETLRDIADPTRAADGSGGNSNKMARFLAATGAITQGATGDGTMVLTNPAAAYSLPISVINEKLRQAWADPAMRAKGLEAIKGNDPSISTYGIAAEIEKTHQRIEGEHDEIVSQAIRPLRTNLGKYSSLFEKEYFSKGKIPTKEEVEKVVSQMPLSALKSDVSAGDIPAGAKFSHAIGVTSDEDLFRGVVTDRITKNILGTLGSNRTAYNSNYKDFFPKKGNAKTDVVFQQNLLTALEGTAGQTKGTPEGTLSTIDYAKSHPNSVEYVRVNGVDEAHSMPYMQIYFKEGTNAAERAAIPKSGIEIPTTSANKSFYESPTDDRTLLLNNRALKFKSEYADGTKSNLSIYNASGDKSNPQFDINSDFSYKTLDVDASGNIKGVKTVYRNEEVEAITKGNPQLLGAALSSDPTEVYNVLANKLIKSRDAVNAYIQSNGKIKTINDLPEFIKTAIKNGNF